MIGGNGKASPGYRSRGGISDAAARCGVLRRHIGVTWRQRKLVWLTPKYAAKTSEVNRHSEDSPPRVEMVVKIFEWIDIANDGDQP